jgi:MFS transporter, ACS family, hexuronate transporter
LDSDVRALSSVSRTRAWGLTGFTTLALAVTLIDRQALSALAETVTASLGISDVGYGWLSSGFAAAYLIGSLPFAQLIQRIGPRFGLVLTLSLSSAVVGLHAWVPGFAVLLLLRIALGLSVAPSLACATQTVHRVMPFKDRARAIGILYLGNSIGSSVCPPLAVFLESRLGWREAFLTIAAMGLVLVPIWLLLAFTGRDRPTFDAPSIPMGGLRTLSPFSRKPDSIFLLIRDERILRGSFIVAAAAPVTTVVLLWGSKYLIRDHGLEQHQVGHYLWLPALMFGLGSMGFGELRARSARTRASSRPPRALVASAGAMCSLLAAVPFAHGAWPCIVIASLAMSGAGGLYSLATSDMLSHASRGTIPAVTGLTTFTQSLVYITVSPIIGHLVQTYGSYDFVMVGAGLWVLPGCVYWLLRTTRDPRKIPSMRPHEPFRG